MPGDVQTQPAATPQSLPANVELCCPYCDYNLAGLSGQRCPECGSAIDVERLICWYFELDLPLNFGPAKDTTYHPIMVR